MSAFDLSSLPAPLPHYFALADNRDAASLFSPDARVRDEGRTHRGPTEIKSWLDDVERRYQPRYVVQDAKTDGNRLIVSIEVTGTFPGSPTVLRQAFTVDAAQRIARLETL